MIKWVLAASTVVLAGLVLDDKARQVSHDAQDAYRTAAAQGGELQKQLTKNVKEQPVAAMLIACGAGFIIGKILPTRLF